MESITLYFRSGPSDKVYQASISPKDAGYLVHFAYGRRGSTLSTGSKTPAPVEYPIAKDIYDRLVREQVDGVIARQGRGDLQSLLTGSDTWTVS